MTPFEKHMRKYHPGSTVARLSQENATFREILEALAAETDDIHFYAFLRAFLDTEEDE